jgi:mRNA-degrading endonuclease toxin of MazEF toxin-antitoxin module
MKAGDVLLIYLAQFGGAAPKLRPAVLLVNLPGPYQTQLVCGVSTQLQRQIPDWDELISPGASDFPKSGLRAASIIRLSYLHAAASSEIAGVIGTIESARLKRLLDRLADHLRP